MPPISASMIVVPGGENAGQGSGSCVCSLRSTGDEVLSLPWAQPRWWLTSLTEETWAGEAVTREGDFHCSLT